MGLKKEGVFSDKLKQLCYIVPFVTSSVLGVRDAFYIPVEHQEIIFFLLLSCNKYLDEEDRIKFAGCI